MQRVQRANWNINEIETVGDVWDKSLKTLEESGAHGFNM